MIWPGAITTIYRIDMPGKKVILFGDYHKGDIENTPYTVETVAHAQKEVFQKFFASLIPIKNAICMQVEANETFCDQLRDYQLSTSLPLIFDYPPSFFDYFLNLAVYDAPCAYVDGLINFDNRTYDDHAVFFLINKFDEFLDTYFSNGCKREFFEDSLEEFFNSKDYKIFEQIFEKWLATIENRLAAKVNFISSHVSTSIFECIHELLTKCSGYLNKIKTINHMAHHMEKTFCQLLFDIAYQASNSLAPAETFELPTTLSQMMYCYNFMADLNLLNNIMTDTHPIVFVHCGHSHADALVEILKQEPQIKIQTLSMTDDRMIYDVHHCYSALHNFIFSPNRGGV